MAVGRMAALRAVWQVARGVQRPGVPGLKPRLRALPRMVGLTLSGRYPGLGRARLLGWLVAAVYLISPVDLVPELFLPVIGLGDDLMLLTWLAGGVLAEAGSFLEWESRRSRGAIRGEVVRSEPAAGPPTRT